MDAMDNDTRPRNYTIGSLQITQKGGKIIDVHSTN